MQEHLIELSVGETIQVGQYTVTLLEVEGDTLCFQIENDDRDDLAEFAMQPDEFLAVV